MALRNSWRFGYSGSDLERQSLSSAPRDRPSESVHTGWSGEQFSGLPFQNPVAGAVVEPSASRVNTTALRPSTSRRFVGGGGSTLPMQTVNELSYEYEGKAPEWEDYNAGTFEAPTYNEREVSQLTQKRLGPQAALLRENLARVTAGPKTPMSMKARSTALRDYAHAIGGAYSSASAGARALYNQKYGWQYDTAKAQWQDKIQDQRNRFIAAMNKWQASRKEIKTTKQIPYEYEEGTKPKYQYYGRAVNLG